MSVELSSSFSSEDWQQLKDSQDKAQIITVLRHRYSERYFEPFKNNESKHGFSMMAVSCLVIESLISLKRGWKKTHGSGSVIFEEFFSTSHHLTDFIGLGADFYKHIRCGILHQAETTGGWRIRRDLSLPIVCVDTKVIHATKFLNQLEKEFEKFLTELEEQEFTSSQWRKVVKKVDYIVANCG
ncbi:hypothetical protein [Photobacterium andalusiense]|uniref:Uncharacterized protein n=1 Tax=Photobacterium andalusiense TaxID=2204296 RepID=A0A1Y6MFE2_9GAMM|nr:hypothetical protein [Photobacterium andalusiense]SMY34508.1 hypothetical protein PAND9192_01363 [Photobacterium andalusiense]